MSAFLHAAIALAIAWSIALWLLHPLLRPRGAVDSRVKRGLQFAAYAATFVAGVTGTRAIANVAEIDLWIAVPVLTLLAYICGFAVGYLVGPASRDLAGRPIAMAPTSANVVAPSPPSSQVAATSIDDAPLLQQIDTTPVARVEARSSLPSLDEDALYEAAGVELESGRTVLATWTRAFAEANGDDNKARATYIRLRVERQRLERAELERERSAIETAKKERASLDALQRNVLGAVDRARRANGTVDAARFRAAVCQEGVADVRELLQQYPFFIHLRSAAGESMLQLASEVGSRKMVNLLLENGARDWADKYGNTALKIAKRDGDKALVSLLETVLSDQVIDPLQAAGSGRYRGHVIAISHDGTALVGDDQQVYASVEAAADAIDQALENQRA